MLLSKIADLPDLSLRQMVFFYELCKIGVVRFDLNNQKHKDVLAQMINMLKRNSHRENKSDVGVRQQLFALVMFQILRYTIPEERREQNV